MPGEGAMSHMIISMRENKNLLRKKSLFKKTRTFLNHREDYIKASIKKNIDIKKLTKEDIKIIREQVLFQRRKENIRTWFLTLLTFFILTIPIVYFIQQFKTSRNQKPQVENYHTIQEKKELFTDYLKSGDFWMSEFNFTNAIFQYENCLIIFPENDEVKNKLVEAYTLNCYYDSINCEKALFLLNKQINKFPNNNELIELKSLIDK